MYSSHVVMVASVCRTAILYYHTSMCTQCHVVMVASVCRTAILYSTIVRVAWKTYIALPAPMMAVGSDCAYYGL